MNNSNLICQILNYNDVLHVTEIVSKIKNIKCANCNNKLSRDA